MTITAKARLLAIASIAALSLAACDSGGAGASGDALPKVAAPAGQAWSSVVTATQDGFVMGNPDAPLKLIEFASPTCSHCAEFSKEGAEALKSQFVNSGRVSLEIRPFMLNPMDLAIASIANCGGTERFFPLLENVYATQEELIQGIQSADQAAAQSALQSQNFPAFARAIKLDTYFAARGMAAADIDTCLSDTAKVTRWQESTTRNGEQFEITGTPTFVLNGEVLANAGTWDAVRERLEAAGAR
jgi:protein-disulfide isomerase